MTPAKSSTLPPLSFTLARRLLRLCNIYDTHPHLKSLLKSPMYTSTGSAMMRDESESMMGDDVGAIGASASGYRRRSPYATRGGAAGTTPMSLFAGGIRSFSPSFGALGGSNSVLNPTYTPLERAIIKQVYPSDQQIYYKPIDKGFRDILRRVWSAKPPQEQLDSKEYEALEQERLDAAFTFVRILNENLKDEYQWNQQEEQSEEQQGNYYDQLFGSGEVENSTKRIGEQTGSRVSSSVEQSTSSSSAHPARGAPLSKYNIKLGKELKPGTFLVAHPITGDGIFHKTVIFISEHMDRYGTIGFIINKGKVTMRGQERRTGGPVVSGKHRLTRSADGTITVQRATNPPQQYSKARFKLIKKSGPIAPTAQPTEDAPEQEEKELVFFNSTEWSPGQLESELERGGWFLVEADPNMLYDHADSGEDLWSDLMMELGGEYKDFIHATGADSAVKKRPSRSGSSRSIELEL